MDAWIRTGPQLHGIARRCNLNVAAFEALSALRGACAKRDRWEFKIRRHPYGRRCCLGQDKRLYPGSVSRSIRAALAGCVSLVHTLHVDRDPVIQTGRALSIVRPSAPSASTP